MAEMFGLSSPVPHTMSTRPRKNGSLTPRNEEMPIEMWPAEIRIAPYKIARRKPSSRSATHPPGSDARYTLAA